MQATIIMGSMDKELTNMSQKLPLQLKYLLCLAIFLILPPKIAKWAENLGGLSNLLIKARIVGRGWKMTIIQEILTVVIIVSPKMGLLLKL